MATLNPIQKSIRLPLNRASRVLMCSATAGTECNVAMQLNDSNSSSELSNQSILIAPASSASVLTANVACSTLATLSNALAIGYEDSDAMCSLQTASLTTSYCTEQNVLSQTIESTSPCNTRADGNSIRSSPSSIHKVTISRRALHKDEQKRSSVQTISASTNTTNKPTNSYIKNCFIRSSSCSNTTTNITTLAQIMSNSSTSASVVLSNNNANSSSNSNCSSNSNLSSSSSSNDSTISANSNSSNRSGCINSGKNASNSVLAKKSRPKLSSPTRHGPQQCQICSKIFGNASALAKHKLTHSDERKYICAMCSKAFKRQDHLNGHMMTHRNKKPYECRAKGCGKSYCDARSLRRHTENHHADLLTMDNQQDTLSTIAGAPTCLSLSPATATGDANSPDGATCIRTYISTGGTVLDASTGITLSEDQVKAINLPIQTTTTLLSPTTSSNYLSTNSITTTAMSNVALNDRKALEAEGLTRDHLDLISKIMQKTNQTSAQVTVSSPTSVSSYKVNTAATSSALGVTGPDAQSAGSHTRPRTWNMQLLNSGKNVSFTVDENTSNSAKYVPTSPPVEAGKDFELNQTPVAAVNPRLLNIVKVDQKPVECNLCHRKFKNIPALNGHMRLHGGYFKKDPELKKADKRESNGPPLQTASIGVRALIEEKIINKRSKDLNKVAFVVPAPPSNVVSSSSIRRSINNIENFLAPKAHASKTSNTSSGTAKASNIPAATILPTAPTKFESMSLQQLCGLSESCDIANTKQSKTLNNISLLVGTSTTKKYGLLNTGSCPEKINTTTTITKSTVTDPKEPTLIELLKRGTHIAVTAKQSTSPNIMTQTSTSTKTTNMQVNGIKSSHNHMIKNSSCAAIMPPDMKVGTTNTKMMSSDSINPSLNSSLRASTIADISLAETAPLSLTISQRGNSSGADIYTLTYTSDTAGLFDDAEVYNVYNTEMLLQTVGTMQLLDKAPDASSNAKNEHSDQQKNDTRNRIPRKHIIAKKDHLSNTNATSNMANGNVHIITSTTDSSCTAPSNDILTICQQLHSKDLLMQSSVELKAPSNSLTLPMQPTDVLNSPMHSPLSYPTPPSSHENVTQLSPYVEDGQQFVESANVFFRDKSNADLLAEASEAAAFFKSATANDLSDNEKMLKLRNAIEENTLCTETIKVEDLLNSTQSHVECHLEELTETNLSFLTEDEEFLNESHNATSPLSESFFTSGIGSAEEVKEALREVLPQENVVINGDNQQENIIDLYYLPGLGLQSQMMPNSEDPLLSSSPRDFSQQRPPPQAMPLSKSTYLSQVIESPQQQQQQTHVAVQQKPSHLLTNQVVVQGLTHLQTHYNTQNLKQGQIQFVEASISPIAGTTSITQTIPSLEPSLLQPIVSNKTEEICTITQQKVLTQVLNMSTSQYSNRVMEAYMHNTKTCIETLLPTVAITTPTAEITTLQPLSNQTNSILKRRLRPNGSEDATHNSKYQPLTPFRSKLRKPSRTHYTPAPMLNPERKGVGLYSNLRKEVGANITNYDLFGDDFDDPVGLVDFSDESKVNLGSAYQAQIPQLKEDHDINDYCTPETLGIDQMWNPRVQPNEKILMRYIELSKSSAVPLGCHSEEVALQTLLKAKGNTAAAVLTLLQTHTTSFHMKWTAVELESFLKGLEKHGKDFSSISLQLGTKTTGECVQMYYFWKKLCVDYKVSHLKTNTVIVTPSNNELKPYVCEVPDCSASFTSKAALHGHTRIHTYGRSQTNNQSATTQHSMASSITACASQSTISSLATIASHKDLPSTSKDIDFPCKVCGKVFNKVKSRSAHMKTHRIQELDINAAVVQPHSNLQPKSQQSQ